MNRSGPKAEHIRTPVNESRKSLGGDFPVIPEEAGCVGERAGAFDFSI
jgi:hypothetical protein